MCYNTAYYKKRLERINTGYGSLLYDENQWKPNYQLSAFTKGKLPVITSAQPHDITMKWWGFSPTFAKTVEEQKRYFMGSFNCRLDTLRLKLREEKPALFKDAVNNPCVIFIDNVYEYHTLPDGSKVPYHISMKDGETFPVAGLASRWFDLADPTRSFVGVTMGTVAANGLFEYVHNKPKNSEDLRMPAILTPEEMKYWLDTSIPVDDRLALATSYPTDAMEAYSVVNFLQKEYKDVQLTDVWQPYDYKLADAPLMLDGADFRGLQKLGSTAN